MTATEPTSIQGSKRWIVALVLLAIASATLAVAVQRNVFPYYSGDRDEPVYRYQAQMLEDGLLTIPRSQEAFFRPWLSGPHGDHLVMAFEPVWPAVLAMSDATTNTMLPALALAAAAAVAGMYAFAVELFRDRRVAIISAALLAFSPFALLLSGTYLNYTFGLALGVWCAAATIRAVQCRSVAAGLSAGLLLGVLFFTRPYDAILVSIPLGLFVLSSRMPRREFMRLARWAFFGIVPLLALALVYNAIIDGSLLRFPTTVQSGGWSRFGWGVRALAPDMPRLNYSFFGALKALGRNSAATPTWIVGSYLSLGIAGLGGLVVFRRAPRLFMFLVAMTLVFPLGYLAWWASSLTSAGAFTGLGPHYYLPATVPLSLLVAVGFRDLATRTRPVLVVAMLLLLVVVTGFFVRPKLDEQRYVSEVSRKYSSAVFNATARQRGRLIVINERAPYPYVMLKNGLLANRPRLDSRVLFAIDRGAKNIDLLRSRPSRRAFRVVRTLTSGAPLSSIHPALIPQHARTAPQISLATTIVNTDGSNVVTAYARFAHIRRAFVLDRSSTKGDRYRVTWIFRPGYLHLSVDRQRPRRVHYPLVGPTADDPAPRSGAAPRIGLVVGAAFGTRTSSRDPNRAELRYYARTNHQAVELLTGAEFWTRLGPPYQAWLPITVDRSIRVHIKP